MSTAIKEKILSVTGKGDILLIVPPWVTTKTPIVGPHILQAVAKQKGFKVDLLYLNLLLASETGLDLYESISYSQPFRMLGERLFARGAHRLPPLGQSPELCSDPEASVFGHDREYGLEQFEYKFSDNSPFDAETFFDIEEKCTGFIREAVKAAASLDYHIAGCSSNWEQNNCSVALLQGIKQLSPGTVTLMGGCNCGGEMAEGIASLSDSIDYIFSGEGELAFSRFLEDFSSGNLPTQRVIPGEPLEDLDSLPLPSYEDYALQRKTFFNETSSADWTIGYETSRGCWWGKCNFCGMNGDGPSHYRQKSAKKTLDDLREIHRRHPGRGVMMVDKVMPVSYRKELLPLLGREKNLPYSGYEQRADLPLDAMIHLKNANVLYVKPGIETLSQGLLDLTRKGVSARQNLLFLRNAASLGITVDWNMLWGFPGDKAQFYRDMLDILPLLHHLSPPRVFRHICIDRFSPYFREPVRFNISNLRPWAVYNSIYPPGAGLDKLALRFTGDYPCEAHQNPGLIRDIAQEITQWKKHWQTTNLNMIPFMDYYMIYDKRAIHAQSKTHVITTEQAREIMLPHPYPGSPLLDWAAERKLGIIIDAYYVPLVTASAQLLERFEAGEPVALESRAEPLMNNNQQLNE